MSSTAAEICASAQYSTTRFIGFKETVGTDCSSSVTAEIGLYALIECNTHIPSTAPAGTQAWKEECNTDPITGRVQKGTSYFSGTSCSDSDLTSFVVDPNWNPQNSLGEQCKQFYTFSNLSPTQYGYQSLACINDGNKNWGQTDGVTYGEDVWMTSCGGQEVELGFKPLNQCGPYYNPSKPQYKSVQFSANATNYLQEYFYTTEDCTGSGDVLMMR